MKINLQRLIVVVVIACAAFYLIGILWGMGTARAEDVRSRQYFTEIRIRELELYANQLEVRIEELENKAARAMYYNPRGNRK